ncbi:MAG: hypothetical protein ACFFB5_01435 [Promethearchaeota archaeon]
MTDLGILLNINIGLLNAITITAAIMTLKHEHLYLVRLRHFVSIMYAISGFFAFISVTGIVNEVTDYLIVTTDLALLFFGLGTLFIFYYLYRMKKRDYSDIRIKKGISLP